MAKFSLAAVETLDYDFTGFPKEDGKGYCTGKGTIPEPSQKALDAYFKSMSDIMGGVENTQNITDIDPEKQKEQLAEIFAAIAKLCQNQPNQEQLMELPPRIKIAFLKWVNQEFQNPEVSSADMRR